MTWPAAPRTRRQEQGERAFWVWEPRWALIALPALMAISAVWMFAATWLRYRAWLAPTRDIGIFAQALRLIADGSDPNVSIRNLHVLGDHANWSLFVLAQPFRLWPGSAASFLYGVQAIAVGATVVPLYRLARRSGAEPLVALACGAAFVLNPWVHNSAFEFHPEVVAIPFLVGGVVCARERRYVAYGIFAFAAVLAKEDLAIVVALLGVYVLVRERHVLAGSITAVAGVVVFVIDMRVISHFNPTGYLYTDRLSEYGTGLGGVAFGLVTKPHRVLGAALGPRGLTYLGLLVLTVGLLALLEPWLLLPAVPTLVVNTLSSFDAQRSILNHYTAPALPFLFAAVAVAAGRRGLARRELLVPLIIVPSLAGAIVWSLAWPQRPDLRAQVRRSDHAVRLDRAVALIPAAAPVAASYWLAPHVSERREVWLFPMPFANPPEQTPPYSPAAGDRVRYVFIDRNDTYYPSRKQPNDVGFPPGETWESLVRFYAGWQILYDEDGIVVARR